MPLNDGDGQPKKRLIEWPYFEFGPVKDGEEVDKGREGVDEDPEDADEPSGFELSTEGKAKVAQLLEFLRPEIEGGEVWKSIVGTLLSELISRRYQTLMRDGFSEERFKAAMNETVVLPFIMWVGAVMDAIGVEAHDEVTNEPVQQVLSDACNSCIAAIRAVIQSNE